MHRSIAAATLAAVALLGLVGCTAAPAETSPTTGQTDAPGGGQSIPDACAVIQQTIADATSEFESADASDPGVVVDAMRAAAERIGAAASQIDNDEVAALLPDLEEMYTQAADVWQAVVDGDVSRLGDLAGLGQTMQESLERYHELCAS